MNPRTLATLDSASKAMWAGDAVNAFRLLKLVDLRQEENPMLYHDVLYNLALLASYLDLPEANDYRFKLETTYDKMEGSYKDAMKSLESAWVKDEAALRAKRLKMPPERRLTYYFSPGNARRELRRDIRFVKGLTLPEIRTIGNFHYSLDVDLLNAIMRGYTERELEILRVENSEGIRITNVENDLVQFTIEAYASDVIARTNGVVFVSISRSLSNASNNDYSTLIFRRLNDIFFGPSDLH